MQICLSEAIQFTTMSKNRSVFERNCTCPEKADHYASFGEKSMIRRFSRGIKMYGFHSPWAADGASIIS
jgi:hypothetical protein